MGSSRMKRRPRRKRSPRQGITNAEIADTLEKIRHLLEIQGANVFRVRAYENAALTVRSHAVPLEKMVAEEADLTELPNVGKDIAGQIAELVRDGRASRLEELGREIPISLLEILRLPGTGAKSTRALWQELGVETLEDLERVAREGKVASLKGFGKKTQTRILEGIERLRKRAGRFLLSEADEHLGPLLEHLRGVPDVLSLEVAGSYRRRRETVGDIDLLAITDRPEPVMDAFTSYSRVREVRGAGGTRATVVLASGLQVDLRAVPPDSHGAAMVYFTGSKQHNIVLRTRAVKRGLRISEYGVFREQRADRREGERTGDPFSGERVCGATEEEVYAAVDLPWIPPELREDRGEIAAAEQSRLPELIEIADLRGDLQMHSTWSDGRESIETMVEACVRRGYEYLAITDHSKSLAMIGGLDADRLAEQWREIDDVQGRHPEIRVLRSLEVDILADGSLDLEDELLGRLDVVVAAIHSRLDLPAAEQTARILAAIRNPRVQVLAHPTGRLIHRREGMSFDLDAVLDAAAEHGVAMELNAHPERLDLRDTHLIEARRRGVRIVISTDAHGAEQLELMRYGVEQARRAWLTADDVLNTLPVDRLLASLRR